MSIMHLLAEKRDGKTLSDDDIKFIVDGYVAGDIPDYQMAAFLMATFIRGLDEGETYALTKAMADNSLKPLSPAGRGRAVARPLTSNT